VQRLQRDELLQLRVDRAQPCDGFVNGPDHVLFVAV
jgi:hypothetical protein